MSFFNSIRGHILDVDSLQQALDHETGKSSKSEFSKQPQKWYEYLLSFGFNKKNESCD